MHISARTGLLRHGTGRCRLARRACRHPSGDCGRRPRPRRRATRCPHVSVTHVLILCGPPPWFMRSAALCARESRGNSRLAQGIDLGPSLFHVKPRGRSLEGVGRSRRPLAHLSADEIDLGAPRRDWRREQGVPIRLTQTRRAGTARPALQSVVPRRRHPALLGGQDGRSVGVLVVGDGDVTEDQGVALRRILPSYGHGGTPAPGPGPEAVSPPEVAKQRFGLAHSSGQKAGAARLGKHGHATWGVCPWRLPAPAT
jgi:hypothetical protein